MAVFRKVHIKTYRDGWFYDLSPKAKLFWLYLLTNESTTACGIYELPKTKMAAELKLELPDVEELINEFTQKKKIKYCEDTTEVFILNWLKWNPPTQPTTKLCIQKELKETKNSDFVDELQSICDSYGFTLDVEKKIPAREPVQPPVTESSITGSISLAPEEKKMIEIWERVMGVMATPNDVNTIKILSCEHSIQDFEDAVKEAVEHNARNIKYVKTVLNNWKTNGKPEKSKAVAAVSQTFVRNWKEIQ